MKLEQKTECPICECETAHLNNHVRMSNDDGHGPTQTYPDGWDRDQEQFDQEADADVDESNGSDVAIVDDVDEPDAVELTVDDDPRDFRRYDCPECSETVEYLDDECSNGHSQQWVVTQ